MSLKINDEFTALPVSNARKYQLRKQAKGLCIHGGCQRPLRTKSHCAVHSASVKLFSRLTAAKMRKIKSKVFLNDKLRHGGENQ